jgi:tight adherence protein B
MILVLFIALLAAGSPILIKNISAERHRQRMATQFRAALQNIVHALRVGVSFNQALAYTAREGAEPLVGEWNHVLQALRLGQPLSEALDAFATRVPVKEVGWFVTAVQITQSTGGSLADVLDTLSTTLQERQTLREKVAALTAQGKASGVLLAMLPYALLAAMSVVEPEMAATFFHTSIGQCLLAGITLSIGIGGLFIKKIVTIEVE